jgi:predicted ATP-grasp superfamily ATP-dependent carboligase
MGAKVLVLDGGSIASVAIVRSLGKKGIEVTCGEEYRTCTAFFSRYVGSRTVYPSPREHPELFMERIRDLVERNKYDLVVPVKDETTVLLSKHKEELSRFTAVPTAEYQTIMKGRDKARTLKIAMDNGIPCPRTYFPGGHDLGEIGDKIEYPVLVRPCRSSGGRGIIRGNSAEEFTVACNAVKNAYGDFIVQEYVPHSEHYSVCALADQNSNVVASFTYKELRHYCAMGGSATYAIGVKNQDLLESSVKLLRLLGWSGVANLEFIVDERDGEPKLLEINPRFWMSLELAIQSGVDFPYLLYRMATEGHVEIVDDYRVGARYRWLLPADIVWLWNNRTKTSAFRQFFRFHERDLHYAVLSLRDPGPTVGTILQTLRFLTSRERRDFVFDRGR